MKFYYVAEGRQVGAMTVHDFLFERRNVVNLNTATKVKNLNVMVTTFTAKKREDPYNGAGIVEQPSGADT
eukprot:2161479-Amphidinium_carterae.7